MNKLQWFSAAGCALVACLMCSHATPADAAKADASAEGFLRRVYATYKAEKDPPQLESLVTPSLRDLLHRDALALNGEMGAMDADPLCGCQDFDIVVQGIRVDPADDVHATAIVKFTNFGKVSEPVHLKLIKVDGSWRIDDVVSASTSGLRKDLEDEIKNLKKH
ncbi:DUF3828 domain-containing protein [Dyella subtropica]|uniref:DUF3828 domain-containing protein n=1 Tax=Dyella subtropica TaxID=2992127 RepID=UPI0022552F4E|nr:DUF3828 domain-containing protein [Dyella subtropica]